MASAVANGLALRGSVDELEQISLDEKAYKQGHQYATILIDSTKNSVVSNG